VYFTPTQSPALGYRCAVRTKYIWPLNMQEASLGR
jgi:hypothetical protein